MSNTWFLSDLHLRHAAILNYTPRGRHLSMGRQYTKPDGVQQVIEMVVDESTTEDDVDFRTLVDMDAHDAWVIDIINSYVQPRDQLYFIGDLVIGSNKWLAGYWLSQINCVHKHLVAGNHDFSLVPFYKATVGELFETVVDHRMELKLNGKRLVLDHHPGVEWNNGHNGSWHLHGHSHGNFNYEAANLHDKRILDVGWDNSVKVLGQYRPFSFDDVAKYMEGRVSIPHHGKAD